MKLRFLFLLAFFSNFTFAQFDYCIKDRFGEKVYFDSTSIQITKNVVYNIAKKWPGSGIDTLKLDVYEPKQQVDNLEKRPLIVFFYGGAWLTGNKNDAGIKQKCLEWAKRGYVVFAPNYRLGWNCTATDLAGVCLFCQGKNWDLLTAVYRGAQDARACLRYAAWQQQQWKIDTAAIFMGGESAGSFNSLHASHWNQTTANKFAPNAYSLLGHLDSSGIGDYMQTFSYKPRVSANINSCGAMNLDTGLAHKNIPVVHFHDNTDCVVPYNTNTVNNCFCASFFWAGGSNYLHNKLKQKNITSLLYTTQQLLPLHCSYPALSVVNESACFLKNILCKTANTGSLLFPSTSGSCSSIGRTLHNLKHKFLAIWSVFPSPAQNQISIVSENTALGEVTILDATGRRMIQEKTKLSELQIETSNWASGIYFVFLNNERSHTKKIVIQH